MFSTPDIRFRASGQQTIRARCIFFPVRVRVSRPSGALALGEARSVVAQFRQAAEQVKNHATRLSVPGIEEPGGNPAVELAIEQGSKKEVRLEFTFVMSLGLDEAADFWDRADAIAAATDFLQGLSQQPREKGIDVDILLGKLLGEVEAEPGENNAEPS